MKGPDLQEAQAASWRSGAFPPCETGGSGNVKIRFQRRGVLPGFGLSMGYTVLYLSLIVLIPLSTLFFQSMALSWERLWAIVTHPRVLAAFRLSLLASLAGACVNAVFGFILAWTLVRYDFPGRRVLDALIDLPFALPTAISGIALTALYAPNGWIGKHLAALGLQVAYTPLGVAVALTFVGIPFVVRTLQPALEDLEREVEEAAESLGASRWQTFTKVIFPSVLPAFLTGFSLALARAIGEYGSVVFISGNMPMRTEILPLLIVGRLEQFDYAGATAIALAMLLVSLGILLLINFAQWLATKRGAAHG